LRYQPSISAASFNKKNQLVVPLLQYVYTPDGTKLKKGGGRRVGSGDFGLADLYGKFFFIEPALLL